MLHFLDIRWTGEIRENRSGVNPFDSLLAEIYSERGSGLWKNPRRRSKNKTAAKVIGGGFFKKNSVPG
jgi:hypothetical protein